MAFLDEAGIVNMTSNIKTFADLTYQEKLISGNNIKTINNTSLLGGGNLSTFTTWYGTSDTESTITTKVSTINNYELILGSLISITFSTANTAKNKIKLNISNTGAKDIYAANGNVTSSSNTLLWEANETLTFVYTGSYYYLITRSNPSYIKKEGDTINGSFNIKATNIDLTSMSTVNTWSDNRLNFIDNNDTPMGYIDHFYLYNSNSETHRTGIEIVSTCNIEGTDKYNGFYLGFSSSGTPFVSFSSIECRDAWATSLNVVKKSGDTMTGNLYIKYSDIDASKADNNITTTVYPTCFRVLDSLDRILNTVESYIKPDGIIGSKWYIKNYDTSGSAIHSALGITMEMDKSGSLSYTVSSPAAFRTAIGSLSTLSIVSAAATSASTVASNSTRWITVPLPSNKTAIAVVGYYLSGGDFCTIYNLSLTSSGAQFALRNHYTSTQNVTITAYYLCR